MKVSTFGLPEKLIADFYNLFDKGTDLIQLLDLTDYVQIPISYSLNHSEPYRLMVNLSLIVHFENVFLYNILFGDNEIFLNNTEVDFFLSPDDDIDLFRRKTRHNISSAGEKPWLFPYDKILIADQDELDLFMVDLEEFKITILLVKKDNFLFQEILKAVTAIIPKLETIEYIHSLSIDSDIKSKLLEKCDIVF